MNKKNRVKRYSKLYKKLPKKYSLIYSIFKHIVFFLVVAALSYFSSMALNSYLKRPHCTIIEPLDEFFEDENENVNLTDNETKLTNYDKIFMSKIDGVEVDLKTANSKNEFDKFLKKLVDENKNAVVVCLKSSDGLLKYDSEIELAKQWKTIDRTKLDLSRILNQIEQVNLIPIARISSFFDQTAPSIKNDNSFVLKQTLNIFSENLLFKSGKWLNPALKIARNYISSIAQELTELGFKYVLIDDVAFPMFKTKQEMKYFDDYDDNVKIDSLLKFVDELKQNGVNPIFSYNSKILFDYDLQNALYGNFSKFLEKNENKVFIFSNENDFNKFNKNLNNIYTNFVIGFENSFKNKNNIIKNLNNYDDEMSFLVLK